jgi:hypothetical protein
LGIAVTAVRLKMGTEVRLASQTIDSCGPGFKSVIQHTGKKKKKKDLHKFA